MNKAEILVVGVVYNTYPETLRYLDSFIIPDTGNITLVLVDNSSCEKPQGFMEKINSYPFLDYIETGNNPGYFGGARVGIEHYLSRHATYPEWVLVTNVDIVFEPRFFTRLSELAADETLGVVAPSIISDKWKTDYNPGLMVRYSGGRLKFYHLLYSSVVLHNLFLIAAYTKMWLAKIFREKREVAEGKGSRNKKMYASHGSCMIFNRNYFSRGGDLDLPNFLYGEEIHVAEHALRAGLAIEYHPELVIHDFEHASTGFFVTSATNRFNRQAVRAILDRYYR
ncbi:MAG: glycosyltransferase [Bacteroidota bacterium]